MRSAVTHERGRGFDGAAAFEETRARESRRASGRARARAGEEARRVVAWTGVALALRVALLFGVEHVITPDGVMYAGLVRALAAGRFAEGLSTYWPPLYPALAAAASLLFADVELAGRIVSVVAGALVVVPVYRLARDSYGRDAARLAASLAALHPLLVYYSTLVLTESVYTLLFACGACAGWSAVSETSARKFLTAGAIFGACYLLKPEAAGFVLLLVALALAARVFSEKRASLKTSLLGACAACAGFLVVASPYLVYLRRETGGWILSGKLAGHLWQGSRRAGESAPQVAGLFPDATTAVVQLTKALRYEYELLNLLFPTAFVVAAALGLFASRWTRERARRELYLLLFFAATLAGYAVTLPNVRFLVPLTPLVICWTARGVGELERWAGATARRAGVAENLRRVGARLFRPAVVALLLLSLLPMFVYLLRGDKWGDYYGQKRAALWIRDEARTRGDAAPAVMSTAPVAAFYAGGRHVALVDEETAELVERARREGVSYVVINERGVKETRLRRLLDPAQAPPALRLAHGLAESPEHRILVYTLASP
ncbi:MAG TPA: glycosyltransferase family 39 protein [Pyrinomonadaceae bacterium]|nr:glycosyltransferase family 39 protein [Pyrinomonadaceae bacterium]